MNNAVNLQSVHIRNEKYVFGDTPYRHVLSQKNTVYNHSHPPATASDSDPAFNVVIVRLINVCIIKPLPIGRRH